MKSIGISEETHKQLVELKLDEKAKSTDELIRHLIVEHRKRKLLEASEEFRERMKQRGLKFSDVLKGSKRAREEIYHEWFD